MTSRAWARTAASRSTASRGSGRSRCRALPRAGEPAQPRLGQHLIAQTAIAARHQDDGSGAGFQTGPGLGRRSDQLLGLSLAPPGEALLGPATGGRAGLDIAAADLGPDQLTAARDTDGVAAAPDQHEGGHRRSGGVLGESRHQRDRRAPAGDGSEGQQRRHDDRRSAVGLHPHPPIGVRRARRPDALRRNGRTSRPADPAAPRPSGSPSRQPSSRGDRRSRSVRR